MWSLGVLNVESHVEPLPRRRPGVVAHRPVRRGDPCLQFLEERGAVPYPMPTHAPDHGGQPISPSRRLGLLQAPDARRWLRLICALFPIPALRPSVESGAVQHGGCDPGWQWCERLGKR